MNDTQAGEGAGGLLRPWWRGAVIYEVYPRSFCDSKGDGIGDLAGITGRLRYVADLGVDAIWIPPFYKSPMKDFGYDVEDFYGIDPSFGNFDDFENLVDEAHRLGLKVIVDQIYSHTSDQCQWFRESRRSRSGNKADWYVWADAKPDGSQPNNWRSMFSGPAWTWDDGRKQYYMNNFLPEQPDLNLHNPEVRKALLDVSRFWLDKGVDGFRLDATNHYLHDPLLRDNPGPETDPGNETGTPADTVLYSESQPGTIEFLREIRATLDEYPDRFSVAEVGGRNALQDMADFTRGDDLINTAYGFTFLDLKELSAPAIRQAVEFFQSRNGSWPSWTFNNHDCPRVVSRWGSGHDPVQLPKTLLALLLALRGTVFLYQGEELGLPQADLSLEQLKDPEAIANWPDTLGRDGARTPMPWRGRDKGGGWVDDPWMPLDDAHYALCVERQREDPDSTLNFCRRLLRFRKRHPAFVEGSIEFGESPDDVLAFIRACPAESLLCVFNLGTTEVHWQPEIEGKEEVGGFQLSIGGVNALNPSLLPPLGAYVSRLR